VNAASRAEPAHSDAYGTPTQSNRDRIDETVSVADCALDNPGHRAHWMPPSRTLFGSQTPNAVGTLGTRKGWFTVEREDGATIELWHHDAGWLTELFGHGPRAVSWVPGTSFITVSHAGGLTFLYADSQETPCRTQVANDVKPAGPRRHL
jgi:hypothetical protein